MLPILNLLFRAKKLIVVTFVITLVCVLSYVAFKPNRYEAHMSFLIRNERADPLVSAEQHQNDVPHGDVTEEEINSEVEVLGSTELLQEVVRACGLAAEFEAGSGKSGSTAIERATRKLSKSLTVTPVRKSSIINVSYISADRDRSVAVLDELAVLYRQKHAKLRTGGTATAFFRNKSSLIEQQLKTTQEKRAAFLENNGYSLIPQQKELMVQQLLDVSRARDDAGASLAETESRLLEVRKRQEALAPRILTLDRTSANQSSVERLNTMLVDLQNRRTELATKFHADDPLVVEVDQKISDTRAALVRAEQIRSTDTTTDVNPLREALDAEGDRLLQTRAGLLSRRSDLDAQLERKHAELARIEEANIQIDEFDRDIKELASNLDLYRGKAVAAGVADDLDAAKISNIVIAASPIVPVLPKASSLNVFTGVLFAMFVSIALGLFMEMHSNKIYGPAALEAETGLPVLATLANDHLFSTN